MNVKLTEQERTQLHDTLLHAFPSEGALEQPVYSQFGVKLPAIVEYDSSLDSIVYQLLHWVEESGSLAELIEAARIANPGNAELQQFAKQYRTRIDAIPSATPQLPERALTATLRETLIQALLRIPPTSTFEGRSALLVAIPGSLRRNPDNPRADLAMIIDQLSDLSRLQSGAWPLLIFIDNARAYAEGFTVSEELAKVSQKVARRLYGEDYTSLVLEAS
jgi:Effector-associated domain 1